MNKIREVKHLLPLMMICLVSMQSPCVFAAGDTKKVECSIEIMPNYLWHLFASADLWNHGKSVYRDLYPGTIQTEDLEFLHQNRELIAWGNGATGKFTVPLFFIPLASEISFPQYCSYLDEMLKYAESSDWKSFAEKHKVEIPGNFSLSPEELVKLEKVSSIIKNNFDRYEKEVWKDIKPVLERDKAFIDSSFRDKNIIGLWEKGLKNEFPEKSFVPVLTYANDVDQLASANNLSMSRNNFGTSGQGTHYKIDLMVHEIGIFILMPIIRPFYSDPALNTEFNKNNSVVYQAIESLIEKIKGDIFGEKKEWTGNIFSGGQFDFPWFFSYYEKNIEDMEIESLLRSAIFEFEKDHNK